MEKLLPSGNQMGVLDHTGYGETFLLNINKLPKMARIKSDSHGN